MLSSTLQAQTQTILLLHNVSVIITEAEKHLNPQTTTIQLAQFHTINSENVSWLDAVTAVAVKECAVPLGLNSTWAPCGHVVGV